MLSEDDTILATVARYLFETGKEEEARAILRCALTMYGDDDPDFVVQRRVVVTAPAALFQILSDDKQPSTIAIKNAITNVVPRTRLISALPIEFKVAISFVAGFPDRDEEAQATLLRYARRSESKLFDPLPLRRNAPLLLISPLELFRVDEVRGDDQLCFIIMPFAKAFTDVEKTIRQSIAQAGLTPMRGDDIQQPGNVMSQVWQGLLQARHVIADLSLANGNVLYELGLAHAIGHNAILLTQNRDYVPFDLRSQRLIEYTPTQEGLKELEPTLTDMLSVERAERARTKW